MVPRSVRKRIVETCNLRAPMEKAKKPRIAPGLLLKERQRPTLPGFIPVPSALVVLTSLFGMGRGDPHRYSRPKLSWQVAIFCSAFSIVDICKKEKIKRAQWQIGRASCRERGELWV